MRNVIIGAAALIAVASAAVACGPDFPSAVFVNSGGPDDPDAFIQGELGIVLPSFGPSWLVAAYRHLSGAGFGKNEMELLFPRKEQEKADVQGEFNAWITDRRAIPGVTATAEVRPYRYIEESYMEYLNCTADSFATARKTLRERVEEYGPLSPELKEWVMAQDQVFANCGGTGATIPPPAPPDSRPLVKADREYQIAAAYFYARRFDEAEQRFRSIAADAASPWRERAPYLVARALIRKGTLVGEGRDFDEQTLAAAEKELLTMLADNGSRKLHDDARRLLAFVRFRLYPAERFVELGNLLAKPANSPTLSQEFEDFQLLAYRLTAADLAQVDPAVLRADLTDWIASWRSNGAETEKHVFARWQQDRNTPWLLAALAGVSAGHPGAQEILKAAAEVKEDDPGYLSVAFYRARLLAKTGKTAEERTLFRALANHQEVKKNPSAVNLIRAELLEMAESLDDFLRNAARPETGEAYMDGGQPGNPEVELFDEDAARQLSWGMPLELLKQAALKDTLGGDLRADLLLAATVRAMLLNRPEVARETAPPLAKLLPAMKAPLDDYLAAATDADRDFAAAVLMLKFPGALPYIHAGLRIGELTGIDSYSEKWWCEAKDPRETEREEEPTQTPPQLYPPFVSAEERATAEKEGEEFTSLDTAMSVLTERVISRVKAHPEDKRLPEALHLVIVYARYGCTDEETRKLSKQAFQLLHKKYPGSDWARKTKYWY